MNTLLPPKPRQDLDCLTPLAPMVRGRKLVERRGNVAIYQGPTPGAYELIIIRISPERVLDGVVIPSSELYPSAEHWGVYGWTFSPRSHHDPLKAARDKMKKLGRTTTATQLKGTL